MELRPYQQEALNTVMQAMRTERYLLVQAATGAGKTIFFSALIKLCMEQYSMRIGILAHREILVRQALEKLLKVWPEGKDRIGLACASVSGNVNLRSPVLIGSSQTLAARLGSMPPLDLIIIDECHRVPPANKKSQYQTFLKKMEEYYPKVRVLGVTATPYRLGHGYVYGNQCRKGERNWWPKLHASIGISTLQEQGFLVPLRAFQAEDISSELSSVRRSNGEFAKGELSDVMVKEVHISSAVRAYEKYAEDRRHVVAFCVTIRHAERLQKAFADAGYPASVIHSEQSKEDRSHAMADFEAGESRVICNVGVLTEGWDCTAVDCILMCRPTMSPALYVQMVGRGLRPHPGKKDCLLLDLSGNCVRHGNVDDPDVKIGGEGKKKDEEEEKEERTTVCPKCHCIVSLPAKECPECGYIFPGIELVEKKASVNMTEVNWGAQAVKIHSWNFHSHTSKRGNHMAQLSMLCAMDGASLPIMVNAFFDFEAQSGPWMQSRSRKDWWELAGTPPPASVDEALTRMQELRIPDRITVIRKQGYYNVVSWTA